MKIYILIEYNEGTPESNEIVGVHDSEDKAYEAGISYLMDSCQEDRATAVSDFETYMYIDEYEMNKNKY